MPPCHDLKAWEDARDERMEQPKLTACQDCMHFRDTGSMASDKKCGASPVELFFPIKGERGVYGFHTVFEINKDGACTKFVEKAKEN